MTIAVRLPKTLEADLRTHAEESGTQISDFVRDAIVEKLARVKEESKSPYELGKHFFGKYGSGRTEVSSRRKEIVREAVLAKHHRR